jgi:Mn2+/Fe2+ NRAMP family transporter
MTSAQLILVSVTSALVAVFAMLIVATIRRARSRDDEKKKDG